VKTPPMFMPQEDGKLAEIPAEHAAILELYRDRMPVVFEVQESGPPMLFALIDVDEEPYGTPRAGVLENAALAVARDLKRRRLGEDLVSVDFGRLAHAAIRAHVADMADFGAGCAYGDGQAVEVREAKAAATRAARQLTKAIEGAVRDAVTETTKKVTA